MSVVTRSVDSLGGVIYAVDIARMSAFYETVAALERVEEIDHDFVELATPAVDLVIVQIPEQWAREIVIADPPERREEGAVKLAFPVASIAAAREAATARGGVIDAPSAEWSFGPWTVCDGHDPEGNVFQVRQRI